MESHPMHNKFRILTRLAKLALLSLPFIVVGLSFRHTEPVAITCGVLALLAILPCFIFGYVLTILHWKARYRGEHSDLWGVLLLVETSGWFKLIYFFRHMLPDMRGRGRYRAS